MSADGVYTIVAISPVVSARTRSEGEKTADTLRARACVRYIFLSIAGVS